MATNAGIKRMAQQSRSRSAATPRSPAITQQKEVPFEVTGDLSDDAIEALAGLLLALEEAAGADAIPKVVADDPRTSELVP